ncbi:hypothetical protein B0H10DRAFT_2210252 [Mycena sp. CBHHK59/15]|nr:hypothetical protein B0H10DRAFT_2210252 [Mycena sp. CBHHK59/15]
MQGPSLRRTLSQQQTPSSRVPGSPPPRITDSPGPSPLPERVPDPDPRLWVNASLYETPRGLRRSRSLPPVRCGRAVLEDDVHQNPNPVEMSAASSPTMYAASPVHPLLPSSLAGKIVKPQAPMGLTSTCPSPALSQADWSPILPSSSLGSPPSSPSPWRPQDTSVDSDEDNRGMQDLSPIADTTRKRPAASFEEEDDDEDHQPVQCPSGLTITIPSLGDPQQRAAAGGAGVFLLIFGQMIVYGREIVPDKERTLM